MTQSDRSRCLVSLVGCAVFIYALLPAMGTGCALGQAGHAHHHQRHHSDDRSSPQGVVCAWACHATVDVTVASGPPHALTTPISGQADIVMRQPVSNVRVFSDRTRAPPMPLLVSLV